MPPLMCHWKEIYSSKTKPLFFPLYSKAKQTLLRFSNHSEHFHFVSSSEKYSLNFFRQATHSLLGTKVIGMKGGLERLAS